jgi:hypothetical protein
MGLCWAIFSLSICCSEVSSTELLSLATLSLADCPEMGTQSGRAGDEVAGSTKPE